MKKRLVTLTLFLFALAAAARADEVRMTSGKILTGKITAETDKTYTMKLGANMYLSISKDEVQQVTRSKPAPADARPVFRLESARTDKSSAAVAAATPEPVAVKNARDFTSTETFKIGAANLQKVTIFRTYDVQGADFAAARQAILDPSRGKGFLEGKKRRSSRTEWQASWSGSAAGKQWKSLVVVATVTVSLPAWRTKANIPAAEGDLWGAFLKEATDHEMGHLEIIQDALVSFSESASNLSEAGESELKQETASLFSAIQLQTARRRQGYERRLRGPTVPVKKKEKKK